MARTDPRHGIVPTELIAGVERYAKFCEATSKSGTEFVKMTSTFFGPSKFWLEPWTLPKRNGSSRGERSQSAIDAFAHGE